MTTEHKETQTGCAKCTYVSGELEKYLRNKTHDFADAFADPLLIGLGCTVLRRPPSAPSTPVGFGPCTALHMLIPPRSRHPIERRRGAGVNGAAGCVE